MPNETVEFVQEGQVVATQEITEPSATEMAANVFATRYPAFAEAVDKLTGKSARRLLKALVGVPLIDPKFNHKNELEQSTFMMAERLLEAKLVVALNTLYEYNKEIQDATVKPETVAPLAEKFL